MIKIIAFITVFNEEEIIEKCIENAKKQGLEIIVVDNGCTDRTMEIAEGLGIRLLEHKTEKYNVHELNKWAISQVKRIGCDWYVQLDADEMFDTYDGRKVVEVVNEANDLDYNCMRFDLYEFWPTLDDDLSIMDFTERIQYYSYLGNFHLKMVKNSPEIWTNSSHKPKGTIKESPQRLILKHYKFINLEQGRKKVKSRLERYYTTKGHNSQYNKFTDESKFYVLEKDIYSKLHKLDGALVKEKVFDGWRRY